MNISPSTIEHVQQIIKKPFNDMVQALNQQLGHFNAAAVHHQSQNYPDMKAALESMAGSSGFMLFSVIDHGFFLSPLDRQKGALLYTIGNPLLAIQMTCHDIRAGLYVPIRFLIYETEENHTCIEYDKPSSLLAQFENTDVNKVAYNLDQKIETLFVEAIKA